MPALDDNRSIARSDPSLSDMQSVTRSEMNPKKTIKTTRFFKKVNSHLGTTYAERAIARSGRFLEEGNFVFVGPAHELITLKRF